jgi:hypothetical protein
MPTISIVRKNEWFLRYRRIEIYLNGQSIGYFPKGRGKQIDLPVGQHQLKAKSRLYGSREFNLTLFNKKKRMFVVSTNKFLIFPVFIFISIEVFLDIFRKNFVLEDKLFFITPVLAGMIALYYFTIGRKNCLIIKEVITE